ncbi:MAG: response regulator transcription factor [Anaerolineae bacterium]
MSQETILLIERATARGQVFGAALERKGYRIHSEPSGRAALDAARSMAHGDAPALVILNAASLGSSGLRICQRLHEGLTGVPIIHILPANTADEAVKDCPASIILKMPFTVRKLVNRIRRLMPQEVGEVIETGTMRFAPGTRVVHSHGREKRLTPKAASLLEVFIKHPDETLDRSYLMQQVWETDYLGDTRTLDVHVRWIREAIEKDPRNPLHILTVRGVGYRFVPHPNNSSRDK